MLGIHSVELLAKSLDECPQIAGVVLKIFSHLCKTRQLGRFFGLFVSHCESEEPAARGSLI
jgi:hypothetical protein